MGEGNKLEANQQEEMGIAKAEQEAEENHLQQGEVFQAHYAKREALQGATAKKEVLESLGIDTEGLSDAELEQAVQEVYEQTNQEMEAFILANPDAAVEGAEEFKSELIRKREQQLADAERSMQRTREFGREHVGMYSEQDDFSDLIEQTRERNNQNRESINATKILLTQVDLYRKELEGLTLMQAPGVKEAQQSATDAHRDLSTLEKELEAIQRKPVSRFFGYTENKKLEEVGAKNRDIARQKEDTTKKQDKYDSLTRNFQQRYDQFLKIFGGKGPFAPGRYESLKGELQKEIEAWTQRVADGETYLSNLSYYATEITKENDRLSTLKGDLKALKGEQSQ